LPVQANWYDDEQQVVLIQFDGNWTWAELANGIAAANQLMAEAPSPAGVMCNMTSVKFLPDNILSYAQRLILNGNAPPQFARICVIVGSSPFVRMMVNVAHSLYQGKTDYPVFYCVETEPEGYALIRAHILNSEHPSDWES
jgi:hypothetical protein